MPIICVPTIFFHITVKWITPWIWFRYLLFYAANHKSPIYTWLKSYLHCVLYIYIIEIKWNSKHISFNSYIINVPGFEHRKNKTKRSLAWEEISYNITTTKLYPSDGHYWVHQASIYWHPVTTGKNTATCHGLGTRKSYSGTHSHIDQRGTKWCTNIGPSRKLQWHPQFVNIEVRSNVHSLPQQHNVELLSYAYQVSSGGSFLPEFAY